MCPSDLLTADEYALIEETTTDPVTGQTRSVERDHLVEPMTNHFVARAVQDIGSLSKLGGTMTAMNGEGFAPAYVGSVDGTRRFSEGGARPFGPKALRGSMGSALRVQLFAGGADGARAALGELGFRQVRAAAKDGADASDFDFSGRFALWIGGETEELSGDVEDLESITIPTAGGVESLNVAVAGAVLLFAAGRNRGGADG